VKAPGAGEEPSGCNLRVRFAPWGSPGGCLVPAGQLENATVRETDDVGGSMKLLFAYSEV
jgi:hypothetical protein